MIGHYLACLCPDAEHDILTGKLAPGAYGDATTRCLVGWAADVMTDDSGDHGAIGRRRAWRSNWRTRSVEQDFDALCERFGVERISTAIRNRILANQARRGLTAEVPCSASVS